MRTETDQSLLVERADADLILARRDEFLGLVSHDLRNELSAIGLSIVQIIRNAPEGDRGRMIFRLATNVHRVTLRMGRLLGDLLDVVSIQAGQFTVIRERQDAARVVREIVETLHPLAAAKDISLRFATGDAPRNVSFDRQRILQAIENLVLNALKFTPAGGVITVGLTTEGNRLRFSVKDTGQGIAPDDLDAIFERYAQGAHAQQRGLGLGLYIARHIVEAHDGAIWAESSIGRGSTFFITLPMTDDARRLVRRARPRRSPSDLHPARA
jgi:signal transduction histidine kinase